MNFKHILATLSLALLTVPVCAQDLLARQAPVDKRMKALDSISLRRLLPDFNINNTPATPAVDLYPEWSNQRGRTYDVKKPDEFSIDLRHFCMPCDSRVVTSHFGYRPQFGRNHYGTDIKLYVGDTVRAAFSGKIRTVAFEAKGYGNYVIIRHDNGLETVYGHMSKHLVRENQMVRAGEPIGLGGNTGRSFGSHLHFETRFLGEYIDPEKLFDFQAHDAKGDFYVYRSNGRGSLQGNPHPADPAPMLASNRASQAAQSKAVATAAEEPVQTAKADRLAKEDKKAADKKSKAAREKAEKAKKEKASKRMHSVKAGDTLYSIAQKNNTTVEKLCKINHISESATLRIGQVLRCS